MKVIIEASPEVIKDIQPLKMLQLFNLPNGWNYIYDSKKEPKYTFIKKEEIKLGIPILKIKIFNIWDLNSIKKEKKKN